MKITSHAITKLLEARHSKDVFVSECKDGPTQWGSHSRMDAWVMPRSWAHPSTTGYEIKVSRSDFLKDDKWPRYLDLCNWLYFVAPKDVISKDEVPEQCGLLEVSKNCKRLLMRKKAPLREVEIPESLFRYVLMCRAKITRDSPESMTNYDLWKAWLAEKREKQETGWLVKHKISAAVARKCGEIETRNSVLEHRIKECEMVEGFLEEAGLRDIPSYNRRREAERMILDGVRHELGGALTSLEKATEKARAIIDVKAVS